VAFDLASIPRVPAAFPSQSVIGEINLLTIVFPGKDRIFAVGGPPLCNENGFSKKFLPYAPNNK
jgi:hypothetical protein